MNVFVVKWCCAETGARYKDWDIFILFFFGGKHKNPSQRCWVRFDVRNLVEGNLLNRFCALTFYVHS